MAKDEDIAEHMAEHVKKLDLSKGATVRLAISLLLDVIDELDKLDKDVEVRND